MRVDEVVVEEGRDTDGMKDEGIKDVSLSFFDIGLEKEEEGDGRD